MSLGPVSPLLPDCGDMSLWSWTCRPLPTAQVSLPPFQRAQPAVASQRCLLPFTFVVFHFKMKLSYREQKATLFLKQRISASLKGKTLFQGGFPALYLSSVSRFSCAFKTLAPGQFHLRSGFSWFGFLYLFCC